MSDANRIQGLERHWTQPATRTQALWLLGLLCVSVVLLAAGGESVRLLLRYERAAVLDAGEYWRLLTCHFVHTSVRHTALNLAGTGVIAALFPRHYSIAGWLFVAALSIVAIDLGFVLYEPQLEWYVGLSGVLHGILAAGAIAWWRFESKRLAIVLILVVVAKLAWEQSQGALPLSGDMSVVVDAHLYGAIGGVVAAGILWCGQHRWPWNTR